MNWPANIVLVGAGKVATAIGRQLQSTGHKIAAVWSRQAANAKTLATSLSTDGTNKLEELPRDADLYLLLLADQAIAPIARQLAGILSPKVLVMHTSGATPANVLIPYFDRYGVFYPLQTFSPGRNVNFSTIPLCLFTAQQEDYKYVEDLASRLSTHVYAVNDRQRLQLHLAAIFVNNFTNYLQFIGQELVEEHQLPGNLLIPLLEETIEKLQVLSPKQAQTGPALRQDELTIQRHLSLLESHPDWQYLYRLLSKGIQQDIKP